MAIRLVEVMELTREAPMPTDRKPTPEEFIEAEVRRRTAWTCFLMDSLLSGGKGRKRSLAAEDMAIQLPCERESFVFGEPVCTEHLNGRLRMPPLSLEVGELGGYSAVWLAGEVPADGRFVRLELERMNEEVSWV